MTKSEIKITPDWVASPGETIKENLEFIGMSQVELAKRMGMTKEYINEILSGKSIITPETALKFESVLGMSAKFILNLEGSYRIYLAEKERKEREAKEIRFLKNIPYKEMMKLGWIPKTQDKIEIVQNVKQFLGVNAFINTDDIYAFCRKSKAVSENTYSIISWIRKGELEAQKMTIPEFNREKLLKSIDKIKEHSTQKFEDFYKKLAEELADCGVVLVFIPCLKKTPVYGAVKWITPSKPMIIMSLRYKTNDHFWFTLMHEIYHVLNDKKKSIIIEEKDNDENEEKADAFSSNTLIPNTLYKKYIAKNDYDKKSIESFAKELNIAPGIVVGRLQHDKHLPFNMFNNLKIKYKMENI